MLVASEQREWNEPFRLITSVSINCEVGKGREQIKDPLGRDK